MKSKKAIRLALGLVHGGAAGLCTRDNTRPFGGDVSYPEDRLF